MVRTALVSVALALLVSAGLAAAATQRSIAITSASADGDVVTVKVRITGWKMYPRLVGKSARRADGGHWHVFVDGKYNGFSSHPTTGRTTKLAEGSHTIRVELANNDHSSLKPPVRSRNVTVTIAASGGGGGEPPPTTTTGGGDYGEYGP